MNGIYGPAERGVYYPADALLANGYVNGTKVMCLTAEYQIKSHSGYQLQEKDLQDIEALCDKFNLAKT